MSETPESQSPPNGKDVKGITIFLTALLVGLSLVLLPQFQAERTCGLRTPECHNNMKMFALALHEYHDTYGSFPPAYIADENGRPMHSWRVLILPYVGEANLHAEYHFDEPWDGPNNGKFNDWVIHPCRCTEPGADADPTDATYLAVVGPETMWPGDKALTIDDVPDGTSNTILVVEVLNSGINWMEPRDLEFDTMSFTINDPAGNAISSNHRLKRWGPDTPGVNVAMADGSVRWLDADTNPELVRSLLTAAGGEHLAVP